MPAAVAASPAEQPRRGQAPRHIGDGDSAADFVPWLAVAIGRTANGPACVSGAQVLLQVADFAYSLLSAMRSHWNSVSLAACCKQPAVKTRPFQSLIFLSFNDDTHGTSDVDRAWFCDFEL